jgi:hypothetical protein
MDEVYCVRCHHRMDCVAISGSRQIAWACIACYLIWQLDAGWNRFTARFDPELLNPRYAC